MQLENNVLRETLARKRRENWRECSVETFNCNSTCDVKRSHADDEKRRGYDVETFTNVIYGYVRSVGDPERK